MSQTHHRACASRGDYRGSAPYRPADLGQSSLVSAVGWSGTGKPSGRMLAQRDDFNFLFQLI
jgi:hypothetical protein